MKKILFIAFLLLTVSGCAWLNTQKSNAQACIADASCMAEAVKKSGDLGNTAGQVAGLSGFPWAATIAKPVVSYGSLIVFLCAMGAALKKKQVPNV